MALTIDEFLSRRMDAERSIRLRKARFLTITAEFTSDTVPQCAKGGNHSWGWCGETEDGDVWCEHSICTKCHLERDKYIGTSLVVYRTERRLESESLIAWFRRIPKGTTIRHSVEASDD